MNVVFMGTPDFAVPTLRALAEKHRVIAVFCQPDRPKGRGKKMQACPVKETALLLGIPVHQPKRIRMKKWVQLLDELAPDVVVVAAFGQILSQKVLDVPRYGCLNVHASLLPRWRGASPIHHAIRHGDKVTGVGIMNMVLELDAGPVYREDTLEIGDMGRLELERRLAEMGSKLLLETLDQLSELEPVPQASTGLTYAPIITKDFGYVDPISQDAADIVRTLRAAEGWPAVVVQFRDQPIKLVEAKVADSEPGTPGSLLRTTKKAIFLACAEGTVLSITALQPPGKKVQPAHAFINGYQPAVGETFSKIS